MQEPGVGKGWPNAVPVNHLVTLTDCVSSILEAAFCGVDSIAERLVLPSWVVHLVAHPSWDSARKHWDRSVAVYVLRNESSCGCCRV